MYWQQAKLLAQFFTPEIELLGEKELLHNILPKFCACRFQLIDLAFFNALLIRSELFEFSRVSLVIGKALGLFGLKVEIKGKIFFFLVPLHFLICFRVFLKLCLYLLL